MIKFIYTNVIQNSMSRITINVNDDLEKRFRIKVIEELGGKRGDLTTALEEAIEMWISSKVDNYQQSK